MLTIQPSKELPYKVVPSERVAPETTRTMLEGLEAEICPSELKSNYAHLSVRAVKAVVGQKTAAPQGCSPPSVTLPCPSPGPMGSHSVNA